MSAEHHHEPPAPEDAGAEHSDRALLPFEDVIRRAKEMTLRFGEHIPTLVVEGSKDTLTAPLHQVPGTHEARAQLLYAVGFMLGQRGELGALRQVTFICEAWMSQAAADEAVQGPPSLAPDRIEVLCISRMQAEEQARAVVLWEMVRDHEGHLAALEAVERPGGEDSRLATPLLDAFAAGFQAGVTELN
jgi:hypothetical protein